MLTFNHSYDGGTFEESTPFQKFMKLEDLRQQCLFQIDTAMISGCQEMADRYNNIRNYIEDRMRRVEG